MAQNKFIPNQMMLCRREKLSKVINSYITAFDGAGKTMHILPGASSVVSIFLFVIAVCAPVGIATASIASASSISLVFLVGNGILKTFLKIIKRKRSKGKDCFIHKK